MKKNLVTSAAFETISSLLLSFLLPLTSSFLLLDSCVLLNFFFESKSSPSSRQKLFIQGKKIKKRSYKNVTYTSDKKIKGKKCWFGKKLRCRVSGKWNSKIWSQTSWLGSNLQREEITKLTFRALALRRHFPIRLRRWRSERQHFVVTFRLDYEVDVSSVRPSSALSD